MPRSGTNAITHQIKEPALLITLASEVMGDYGMYDIRQYKNFNS